MPDPQHQGKDYKIRNTEFMVFLSMIVRNPNVAPTPVAMSFSRGEYGMGQALAGLLQQRRPRPMFGCVFEGRVPAKQRHNSMGDWYGIDVSNPTSPGSPPPWVFDVAEYAIFKEAHYRLEAAHRDQLIQVDHEPDDGQPDDGTASAEGERKFG